jgi:hypothetical protein
MPDVDRLVEVQRVLRFDATRAITKLVKDRAALDVEFLEQYLAGGLIARVSPECAQVVVVNPDWAIMELVYMSPFSFCTREL